MAFKGSCLCKAVQTESHAPAVFIGDCYCADCRRESGSGHITAVAVPDAALHVRGEVREYTKHADSGGTIANLFCPVCGTTMFTRPSNLAGLALLRAGTLEDVSQVAPQMNMYVACAPAWDRPPAGLAYFPGMAAAPG